MSSKCSLHLKSENFLLKQNETLNISGILVNQEKICCKNIVLKITENLTLNYNSKLESHSLKEETRLIWENSSNFDLLPFHIPFIFNFSNNFTPSITSPSVSVDHFVYIYFYYFNLNETNEKKIENEKNLEKDEKRKEVLICKKITLTNFFDLNHCPESIMKIKIYKQLNLGSLIRKKFVFFGWEVEKSGYTLGNEIKISSTLDPSSSLKQKTSLVQVITMKNGGKNKQETNIVATGYDKIYIALNLQTTFFSSLFDLNYELKFDLVDKSNKILCTATKEIYIGTVAIEINKLKKYLNQYHNQKFEIISMETRNNNEKLLPSAPPPPYSP